MNKYIIKNCPAYDCSIAEWNCLGSDATECKNGNCILKQIVEKCKKEIKVYRNTILPNDGTNTLHFGRQSFAYDILKLLDIQEIE